MRVADRDPNHDTNSKNDTKILSYNAEYHFASQPAYPASYLIMLHMCGASKKTGATRESRDRVAPLILRLAKELEHTILAFATPKRLGDA
jgi:hypothetical protein